MTVAYPKAFISQLRSSGLSDGLREMEPVMRQKERTWGERKRERGGRKEGRDKQTKRNSRPLIWPGYLTPWRCHAIKWDKLSKAHFGEPENKTQTLYLNTTTQRFLQLSTNIQDNSEAQGEGQDQRRLGKVLAKRWSLQLQGEMASSKKIIQTGNGRTLRTEHGGTPKV